LNWKSPADAEFFDYEQPFVHRWTDKFLHSAIKEVTPGQVRLAACLRCVFVALHEQSQEVIVALCNYAIDYDLHY